MEKTQSIWGRLSLEAGETEFIALGNLRLWILLKDADIWVGYIHTHAKETDPSHPGLEPPEDLEWSRWATDSKIQKIQILPVFPDIPLIVKPEYPLKITPSARVQIFARIPVWIRIDIPPKNYQLIEIPTVKLSRTWFGTPLEGELCYHATTKARRDLSQIEPKPYLVNCPILISNTSGEDLDFENFCYRVERLSIYQHDKELWADETRIIYHGESLNSDVIMTGKLPPGIDRKKLLSKPRKEIQKSFATRTFKRIFEESSLLGR